MENKIKVMKKSNKQKLVEYMIQNGNDFTYTEMIKHLLKIVYGEDYVYTWKKDRGFHATNFSAHGYMISGGNCGVYKNESGRWSAKFYTQDEMRGYKIGKVLRDMISQVRRKTATNIRTVFSDVYRDRIQDLSYLELKTSEELKNIKQETINRLIKIK